MEDCRGLRTTRYTERYETGCKWETFHSGLMQHSVNEELPVCNTCFLHYIMSTVLGVYCTWY
jgi:hypothetical protein